MEHNAPSSRQAPVGFDWRDAAEALSTAYDHSWPSTRLIDKLLDGFSHTDRGSKR